MLIESVLIANLDSATKQRCWDIKHRLQHIAFTAKLETSTCALNCKDTTIEYITSSKATTCTQIDHCSQTSPKKSGQELVAAAHT